MTMRRKLNMDQVKMSLVYRMRDLNELPRLRMFMIMTKNKHDHEQIAQVYDMALEVTAKSDADVIKMTYDDTNKQLQIELQQVKVFAMCGGGFLGDFAATLPEQFYIDPRNGRLDYSRKEIEEQVDILRDMTRDTKRGSLNLPPFHKCGVD